MTLGATSPSCALAAADIGTAGARIRDPSLELRAINGLPIPHSLKLVPRVSDRHN